MIVDTSVWSLALRRDSPPDVAEVSALRTALLAGDVFTTGIIVQELFQGIRNPRSFRAVAERLRAVPILSPTRSDDTDAARLWDTCRARGKQVGTVDALIAQLCMRHKLPLLTTDSDFFRIADMSELIVWRGPGSGKPT